MFCRKIWWTPYLCLLGANLCRGWLARRTAAPIRGLTGSFGAAGLTGGGRSQSTTHMLAYRALVLLHNVEPGMTVKKALIWELRPLG